MNYDAVLRRSPTLFGSNNSRGGSYCCVPGCTNSSTDNKTSLRKRSFYRMPLKDENKLRLWLTNIKRYNWVPSSSTRICSAHFEGGQKTNEVDTVGYVPTIFPTRKLSRKSLPPVNTVPPSLLSASSHQDTTGPGRGIKKRKLVDVESDVWRCHPYHYLRDHTYSRCLPVVLDEKTAESVQWDQAWKTFFISNCEAIDAPASTNSEQTDSDNVSADEFIVIIDQFHHFKYDPNDNLDDFVAGVVCHRKCQNFSALRNDLLLHMDKFDRDGFAIVRCCKDGINISQFYDGDVAAVKLSISISPSFSAKVYVHRQDIGMGHGLWTGLPKYFSSFNDVRRLLSKLCTYRICVGNYEDEFSSLVSCNAGSSRGRTHGTAEAYREGDFGARDNGVEYNSTIRSSSCQFLVFDQKRCCYCSSHRYILQELTQRPGPSALTSKSTVSNKKHKSTVSSKRHKSTVSNKRYKSTVSNKRHKSVPKVKRVDKPKGKGRKNSTQAKLERPKRAVRRKK